MKRTIALSMLLIAGSLPASAVDIKKDGWLFPNPAHAEKKAIRTIDATDRIPGKETVVKIYKKNDEMVFETLEVEGEVYSCQFHVKGKDDQPATVYAIVDTDGDGVFESKYNPGEIARVPEWVVQRYFKNHPDKKDPGPAVDDYRVK